MIQATRAAEELLEAARLNHEDPLLQGSLLEFPDYGQVVVTGALDITVQPLLRYLGIREYAANRLEFSDGRGVAAA